MPNPKLTVTSAAEVVLSMSTLSRSMVMFCLVTLSGCIAPYGVMNGKNLRTALDECLEMKLNVLVYQRPDRSVIDVRCIPPPELVNEYVTLRPKLPMNLIRQIFNSGTTRRGVYEQEHYYSNGRFPAELYYYP